MTQTFSVGDIVIIPEYQGKFVVEEVANGIVYTRKLKQGLVYDPRMGSFSFKPDYTGVKKEGRLRKTFVI